MTAILNGSSVEGPSWQQLYDSCVESSICPRPSDNYAVGPSSMLSSDSYFEGVSQRLPSDSCVARPT